MVFTQSQKEDIREIIHETIKEVLSDSSFIAAITHKVTEALDIEKVIDKQCKQHKNEIEELKIQNRVLLKKVDSMEQFTRRNNIRIYGIPEENEPEDIIKTIKRATNLDFREETIEAIHRIGKVTPAGNKAIFVRFKEHKFKEEILMNRKILKNTKIIISEDLSKDRHRTLREAVEKLGRRNVWCLGGKIYCKDGNTKRLISSRDDIDKYTVMQES